MTHKSAVTWWDNLRSGDREALFEMYTFFYQDLYRYGIKCVEDTEMVKDVINELFLELWERHDKLREVTNVKPYLITYFKRKLFTAYKKSKKDREFSIDLEEIQERPYEDYIIQLQTDQEKLNCLALGLKKLSPRQIQLIQLRFFEGLSTQDIAQKTNLSHRSVYNTIFESLKLLKIYFSKSYKGG